MAAARARCACVRPWGPGPGEPQGGQRGRHARPGRGPRDCARRCRRGSLWSLDGARAVGIPCRFTRRKPESWRSSLVTRSPSCKLQQAATACAVRPSVTVRTTRSSSQLGIPPHVGGSRNVRAYGPYSSTFPRHFVHPQNKGDTCIRQHKGAGRRMPCTVPVVSGASRSGRTTRNTCRDRGHEARMHSGVANFIALNTTMFSIPTLQLEPGS
jgi:hypothetical protein